MAVQFRFAFLAALMVLIPSAVAADDVAAFYKGRTISLVVGNEPNTGFDVYARVLARHLGRHIPGQPHLVVQNMVGASGIVAANWLYNVAPRDGSVIATFVHTVPFEPLMGNAAAKYDAAKLGWIGNMESIVGICAVSKASGIEKFDQLFVKETVFGATGATGAVAKYALAIKNLLGAKIRLVAGYKGTASIKLAMQQGEVGGLCALGMSTVTSAWRSEFDTGIIRPIVQTGGGKHPLLEGVPHIDRYAKSKDDLAVFRLIFGTHELGRIFTTTPDAPVERRNALRAAFLATMKDAAFLADAKKTGIDIAPSTGEQVEAFIARVVASPPAIVERAKRAVRND
jgi:tripartite-type tricarboxylate transporter receptor subunit TctC